MQLKNIISSLVKHLQAITIVLLVLVTAALIPLMFPSEGKGVHYDYAVDGIWRDNDLVAPHDFAVQRSETDVEQDVADAKSNLLLYYHYDNTAYNRAMERLNSQATSLSDPQLRRMRNTLDSIYQIGYIQMPEGISNFKRHSIVILEGNIGSQHYATQYVTPLDVQDSILRTKVLVPSIAFDDSRTQLELDSRLSQLATTNGMVRQGELIIAKGEHVTPDKAQIIHSLEIDNDRRFKDHYNPLGRYMGQFVLCLIALIALFMFMKNTRHPILEDNRKVTFIMVLILIMSATTAMVLHINADWVLIVPLCLVPIVMRVFFDMRVALYVHVTTIIILANMVPNPFEFIFYQLIAGMMSIVAVRNFEDRSKFFLVAGVIFISYALIYTFGVLSQESTLDGITGTRYLIFFLNALLSLLAYPLIYLFERLFGLTTNLTLMEISSTNTPALRELSRNAPGTFQHSMQVANISEDLINDIGGHALLAKVGALYHDIGKIQAPLYFTENQNSDFNPHDELDYTESASIIIHHVRDGIMLAKRYHLPTVVQDFIRTHHGTTVTGYFYAKQTAEHPDDPINITDFQYNGPTPFSRETAVVMIVDSVEAACKSLKSHDKQSIDQLVDRIIDDKIRQNQLQSCDLTFGDITKIRKFLKSKMMSIYHSRISYPVASNKQTKS
ncbi:MAG: HDIG domain-containing protein [Bacteroidales bacterium]|nr:HDIG domain-containing protein [Bacteroidales bacterium]